MSRGGMAGAPRNEPGGSRGGPGSPGRSERWGVWGPCRGPLGTNPGDRGAARVPRDAPSVGGYGGHVGAPSERTPVIEERPGFPGTLRPLGGYGGPFRGPP